MSALPAARSESLRRARSRLIFALDVPTQREADALISALREEVGLFKVGKQLFMHAGPAMVRSLREQDAEVFLDLKFHDIPRTVARAGMEAARLGVRMFNVHASGSYEMMRMCAQQVRQTCRREGLRRPWVLAVTVLTSLSGDDLKRVGVRTGVLPQVTRLAKLAEEAGLDGVVASPQEVRRIREECSRRTLIVTPGVRPAGADLNDQKRVMTPGEAMQAGSDYLVVGAPIRDAKDPVQAAREIVAEMESALRPRRVR